MLVMALVMMLVAIFMTGSRGGFLSIVGVVVFVIAARIFSTRSSNGETRMAGLVASSSIVALLFVVGGLVLFLGGGDSLVRGIGASSDGGDISNGRFHFWSVAWKIFLDNPIIGAGLDAFGVAFPNYDTASGFYRVEQAHNEYLQMMADGGIFALACVCAFIAILFSKAFRAILKAEGNLSRGIAIGAAAGCFGILIHSFFDFPLRTYSNSFFFLLLVVLATHTFAERKKRRAN